MFLPTSENLQIRNTIVERLKGVPIGRSISNDTLAALSQGRPHLKYAAMKILEQSDGIVFENIRGVGFKRIQTSELPQIGVKSRRAIARKARTAQRRIVNGAKFANDLDRHTRLKISQELGILGLLQQTAKDGF